MGADFQNTTRSLSSFPAGLQETGGPETRGHPSPPDGAAGGLCWQSSSVPEGDEAPAADAAGKAGGPGQGVAAEKVGAGACAHLRRLLPDSTPVPLRQGLSGILGLHFLSLTGSQPPP